MIARDQFYAPDNGPPKQGDVLLAGVARLVGVEAERQAEEDQTLDRAFMASPLISPDDVGVDRRQLMDGKILGYFPIPESEDGLIPETVADLTYRVTLDRLDVVRIACISPSAQTILRYLLARLDALRSPTIGFDLEAVIGQRIEHVESNSSNPLEVELYLKNGETIKPLKQPGGPEPGLARTRGPGQ